MRAMKARAEGEMARRGLTDRELKRGRGGIRDIEFAVQLLQLVHGRADPSAAVADDPARARRAGRPPATSTPTSAAASPPPTGSCAPSSTACSCGTRPRCTPSPTGGEALERLARVCGYRGTGDAGRGRRVHSPTCAATRPRRGRSTSGCSSGRCSRRSARRHASCRRRCPTAAVAERLVGLRVHRRGTDQRGADRAHHAASPARRG